MSEQDSSNGAASERTGAQESPEHGQSGAGTAPASIQEAAASVQEAAAETAVEIKQTSATRGPASSSEAERVTLAYFQAINGRDLEGAVAMWATGGRENVRGQVDVRAPEGVREFIGEMLDALPDLNFEIRQTIAKDDRCGAQWRLTGTFAGPGRFNGLAPTGDRIDLEGLDLLKVRGGLIQSNDAFLDTMAVPRQLGVMPAAGSSAEQRMLGAFNLKTRVSGLAAHEARLIAEGVWVVQGEPGHCNVFLIEDEGGVTLFDAGARTMTRALASAGARLGGIRRVVLGHGHTDHRGGAAGSGVPVLCHPDEVQDAEGSGGFRYWPADLSGLPSPVRQVHRILHRLAWDGGPVKIAGTVEGGRSDRRLSGDRHPWPRAWPDLALARLGPAGARQRLLLHPGRMGTRIRAPPA